MQRNQISNCQHLLYHRKSKRIPVKCLLLLYWLCQSLWMCGSQQTGKFFKRWEYQMILSASWEICMQVKKHTTKTGHETMDGFQMGKGVCQGCIMLPCLFNLYAEHIIWNAELDETQAGIKIAGRSINNFRYADDTTLMAEREEELKASWWKWKRRVKKLT